MRLLTQLFILLMAVLLAQSVTLSAADAPNDERKAALAGLPRVPARAAILKGSQGDDTAAVKQWAQTTIEAKEKKALVELAEIKKQVRSEENTRVKAEDDRRRREDKYAQSWGTIGGTVLSSERGASVRVKLTFQVPEITTYRLAIETCRLQQMLANDVVQALGRLDRNGDGKLTADEYRDAGAIISATARLFQPLDGNADGFLAAEEVDALQNIPQNAAAALRNGRMAADAKGFRIKPFDKDGDGVLDVDERKALTMAYVDASLRAAQDAAFYTLAADSLSAARDIVAAKFAEVEVAP